MSFDGMVFYDLETTGLDVAKDRIVEMCFIEGGGVVPTLHKRIDPGIPISPDASAAHGIFDVSDASTFDRYAHQVQGLVDGAILVGYNNVEFDSMILDNELQRAGLPGLKKDEHGIITHPEIDLLRVWRSCEARDLSTAVARFARRQLLGAHTAKADTVALADVMDGMGVEWDLDLEGLFAASRSSHHVDREGKFAVDEEGVIVFTFGKHRDQAVHAHRSYLGWMLEAEFSPQTKAWCHRFLSEIG